MLLPKYYRRSSVLDELGAELEWLFIALHVDSKLFASFVVALELLEKNRVS